MNFRLFPSACLFLLFMLVFADRVMACECRASETRASVAETFDQTENVIRATVIDIVDQEPDNSYDSQLVRVRVDKVYKGKLQAGNILPFGQAGGKDCLWYFAREKVGQTFLFYLNKPTKARPSKMTPEIEKSDAEPRYYVSTCGRSAIISDASADLVFLEKNE